MCIFFRGFSTRDLYTARTAFITYIRPVLEYVSVIWSPVEIFLIDLLERVQRIFSKKLTAISALSYPERLLKLNLESLELRCIRFDLILHLVPNQPPSTYRLRLHSAFFPPFPVEALVFGIGFDKGGRFPHIF